MLVLVFRSSEIVLALATLKSAVKMGSKASLEDLAFLGVLTPQLDFAVLRD